MVPPSALPPRPCTAITRPAAELSRYAGLYRLAPGLELDVAARGGALCGTSSSGGAPVRLWPECDAAWFVKGVDPQVTVARDAAGAVMGLVLHQDGRDRPAPRIR